MFSTSLINKPTRVTRHTAISIGSIFTDKYFNINLKTGIIKTCFTAFPNICFTDSDTYITSYPYETILKKRILTNTKIKTFEKNLVTLIGVMF